MMLISTRNILLDVVWNATIAGGFLDIRELSILLIDHVTVINYDNQLIVNWVACQYIEKCKEMLMIVKVK